MVSAGRSVYSCSGRATFSPQRQGTEERAGLECDAQFLLYFAQAVFVEFRDVLAIDAHRALRWFEQADHVSHQSCLAAAGSADDDEHLSALHRAVDAVENRFLAVARYEILDLDNVSVIGSTTHDRES